MGAEPLRPHEIGVADSPEPTGNALGSAAIVVPVRDKLEITRACLGALRRQALTDTELVVVDDGSGKVSAGALSAHANEVRVLRHERSRGYAAACNTGAAATTADHVVLLNNDTLPIGGWLDALRRYAVTHPRAAIIGSRLLSPDHSVQHAGVVMTGARHFHHLYHGFPGDHPAACRSRRIRMVTGAAMLVRRTVWEELGGLDTGFTNGYEDLDLCLRAESSGHEIHVCADAVLYHLGFATRTELPAGESSNYARLNERWGSIPADDLEHYIADGLLWADYRAGEVRLQVAPELGRAAVPAGTGLEALLDRRALECFELRTENAQLRSRLDDPWVGRVAAVPRAPDTLEMSIVIAVSDHGRIPEILDALRGQSYPTERFEILVVNTSRRISPATAAALAVPSGLRMRVLDIPTPSRAAALNRGIGQARGELVLLLSDDFIPCPELVEQHALVHRDDPRPETVGIGPARFPAHLRTEPLLRWLEDSGELFGVPFTRIAGELPEGFFYGGNTSCKRRFMLEAGPFNEVFQGDAWDDYEFGRRLAARGMRNRFVAGAVATHDHHLTLRERRAVMRHAGSAAFIYDGLYPPVHPWNSETHNESAPRIIRTGWARTRSVLRRRDGDRAEYFRLSLRRAFLSGYRAAARSSSTG